MMLFPILSIPGSEQLDLHIFSFFFFQNSQFDKQANTKPVGLSIT